MTAAVAAAKPAAGRASGSFAVDGKPVTFVHAYAQLEVDSGGKDVLWVLLSEKPATARQLAGRLRDAAASGELNALAFALDRQNQPSDWRWNHPALSIGCALCSDLEFQPSSRTRDEVAGVVFSAKPQTFKGQKYQFRASFAAKIRRASDVGATAAQKAAIRKLQQRGLPFTPDGFYLSRTEPEAIRLFLDAGMKPDTLATGFTETLLLDVLGSDCSDPRVRAVALMLIRAGADPNYRSPEGNMPLLRSYRCAEIAGPLLAAGARLTPPSPIQGETVGQTVMEGAITYDAPEVVRLLVARGYDVAREGTRLLEKARGNPAIQRILRDAGAGRAVVESTAKAAPSTARAPRTPEQARQELNRRKLPFTQAGFWGPLMRLDADATLLFLEAGIPPGVRRTPPQSDTPLSFITSSGCAAPDARRRAAAAAIAVALVAHKADVNASDENQTTPLIHAAESCPPQVVRALLQAGASTKARSRGGATAMMMAVLMSREDNVRLLIDGGYDVASEVDALLPLTADKPTIEALLKQAAARRRR